MDWLNDVAGWIRDAWLWFTTARVASAAALAGACLAIVTTIVGVRTLRQTRRDSQARSRPMLAAELRAVPYSDGSQTLVVKNYGPSIAKNVMVTFEPPILMPENTAGLMTPYLIKRYGTPIAVMTPGMELDNLYFSRRPGPHGRFVNGEPLPDQVTVRIAYDSADSPAHYDDEFPLDTDLLRGRTYVTSSTSPDGRAKMALEQLRHVVASLKDLAETGRLLTREERAREYAEMAEQEGVWKASQAGEPDGGEQPG
jgi:hypothetical protein